MPPLEQNPPLQTPPAQNTSPAKKPMGPWVGTIIIVALVVFGGLYFWGEYLNSKDATETLPLIPGDSAQQ